MTAPHPVPGDGSEWLVGACWFWCGHRVTLVVRLGTVTVTDPPGEAPLHACGPCTARLHAAVADHAHATAHLPIDGDGRAVPLYVPPGAPQPQGVRPRPGARHRTPRTVLGARWQRVVDGDEPDPFIRATDHARTSVDRPGGEPGEKRGVRRMPYHDRTIRPRRRGRNGLAVAALGAAFGMAALWVPRAGTRQGVRRLASLVDESWYWFYQGLLIWLDEDPAEAKKLYDRPPPGIRIVPEEELARRIFAAPDDDAD